MLHSDSPKLVVHECHAGPRRTIGRRAKPAFGVIEGGKDLDRAEYPSTKTPPSRDDVSGAMQLLEATLEGENWFLEEVRNQISRTDRTPEGGLDPAAYPNLSAKTGHNNLIQIAQFFFFLEALDCSSAEQICIFIDAHNRKIQHQISSGNFIMRERELKRALFKANRKAQVRDTIEYYGRPVFAVGELGDLMIDVMSPKTTENMIKELVQGGVMRQRGVGREDPPPTTDPRRVLVEPTEALINSYVESLQRTRRRLALT